MRVRQASAASVASRCGIQARRQLTGAASECIWVQRAGAASECGGERRRNSPSKAWNSFWHFSLRLPKHVVFPFLKSTCVSKRTRRWIMLRGWGFVGVASAHHYVSVFLGLHVPGTWGKGGVLTIDNGSREIHHFQDEFMIRRNNRSAEVFWCRLGNLEQALLDVIHHGIICLLEKGNNEFLDHVAMLMLGHIRYSRSTYDVVGHHMISYTISCTISYTISYKI
jgi:hypothetical protein